MRVLPQAVVIVTSSMEDTEHGLVKRGVTCSSFTSLTLNPPTVLISIYNENIINKFIQSSGHFAANILSHRQIKTGMHFAKSLSSDLKCHQFKDFEHEEGIKGMPILRDSAGAIQCSVSKSQVIGDHCVWYGTALQAHSNPDTTLHPMLYYQRAFRSIGDEIFMQAFENTKLPFEEWTHEAHLRMSWNYISQHGKEAAIPLIKRGIMNYNKQNKDKIKSGYSETITMFYIHIIAQALQCMPPNHTFEDFLQSHTELTSNNYLREYYTSEVLLSPESRETFILPDKRDLP
ncbi:4-hydroxyphenylacetate 3-monooxygenase reductase component-like [Watersipora subatra]|uniref:4-hydroxyphenylacetate 3-monooxygenase reductase component-like n=1 Tax=Watersipora subatra TaxID=2589382 RepID=UPI00355C8B1C